jgi:hypothetical protein
VCFGNYVTDKRLRARENWWGCWFTLLQCFTGFWLPCIFKSERRWYENNIFLNTTHKKGGGWVTSSSVQFFADSKQNKWIMEMCLSVQLESTPWILVKFRT